MKTRFVWNRRTSSTGVRTRSDRDANHAPAASPPAISHGDTGAGTVDSPIANPANIAA